MATGTAILIASACSGGEVTASLAPADIVFSAASATLGSIGESVVVTATVKDQNDHVYVATISWRSADPQVAAVSGAGAITAVGNGTTSITATAGSVSKSLSVTVRQEPSAVVVTPAQSSLAAIGATATLLVDVTDLLGNSITDMPATWTSSPPDVVTVAPNGVVTAVGKGTTVVTASVGSKSGSATITVDQQPTQLTISPPTLDVSVPGPSVPLTALAKDARGNAITPAQVTWSSSNLGVAGVSSAGVVTGVASGTAVITATLGTVTGTASVTVRQDPTMVVEAIDPFLATPASGSQWEIPVLVVRYLPTTDGLRLDQIVTGYPFAAVGIPTRPATLVELRKRIDVFDRRVKFMLEEGSRFRGYANPQALPALGYRIVQYITVYEPMPLSGRVVGPCNPTACSGNVVIADYRAILSKVNAQYWINTRGVKEIWVWGYEANSYQPESNMSSPTTGDISNSYRISDDLPIYNTTYTVYGYNFARTQNEAVHNHGHQLEAILSYADERQNGNTDLFWKSFVGQINPTTWGTGRAGWTHMPPNTTGNYDYLNPTPVLSDIEDWRPDNAGVKTAVSSNRWRNLSYNWPSGLVPLRDNRWPDAFQRGSNEQTEAQWYIYWMQSMPGRGSAIPHLSGQMTNWWTFTANWDAAITAGTGLSTVPNGVPISIRNDFSGGIFLSPGGGLAAGQSVVLYALTSTEVSVWDCGEPGATGCIFDKYTLQPGKSYRVIQHPSGPPNNLTIVER